MKKRVILPVCMQEEINNFMNNSLYLCILLTNENMWEWYYEHYVQIFYIEDKSGRYDTRKEMWMDFYGGATEPREFMVSKDYYRSEIENLNFETFFKERIEEGNYIYTFIDESYLGGVNHNAHDFLLYGFDDIEQCFHCICFYNRKFDCVQIPYDVFCKSYQDAMDIAAKYDRDGGRGYVETFKPKHGTDYSYQFNMEAYLVRLRQYLDSINSGKLYQNEDRHHEIYQNYDSVYGISVYDAFRKVVNEVKLAGDNMDYRPYKTIFEHKKAMRKRWEFFREKGFLSEEEYQELSEQLKKQEERAESMRFLAYRHHLKRKETFLEEIMKLLVEVRDEDVRIVERQLELLIH